MAVRPRYLEGMKKLGNQIIYAGGLLDEKGKMKSFRIRPTQQQIFVILSSGPLQS